MQRIFYHKTGVCQLNGDESINKSVPIRQHILLGHFIAIIFLYWRIAPCAALVTIFVYRAR